MDEVITLSVAVWMFLLVVGSVLWGLLR